MKIASFFFIYAQDHKKTNPKLKTIISLGGWEHPNINFTNLCKYPENTEHFAKTTITFLRKHGFDGKFS